MVNSIRVMKHNSVYRLGDLLLCSGLRWQLDRQTIMQSPTYSDTLLREYFTRYKITNQKINFNDLKSVTDDHRIDTPQNELLLNIRCGDIVSPNCSRNYGKCNIFNHETVISQISKTISPQIETIKIVAAMHYGSDDVKLKRYYYTDEKHEKNMKLLNRLFEMIRDQFNIPVCVDVSDLDDLAFIDYQFLKLVYADNVILDSGGFSRVVQEIRGLKE